MTENWMLIVRSDRSVAFCQGALAAVDGRPASANPYLTGMNEANRGSARAWGRGWFRVKGMKRRNHQMVFQFKSVA